MFTAAAFNVEVVLSVMLPSSSKSVKRKWEFAIKTKTTTSPGLRSLSAVKRSHPCSHSGSLLGFPNETLHVRPSSFSKLATLPSFRKCSLTNGAGTVYSKHTETNQFNKTHRKPANSSAVLDPLQHFGVDFSRIAAVSVVSNRFQVGLPLALPFIDIRA